MIFARFQSPFARIVFAAVYILLAFAAIFVSRDIMEKNRQKVFYQVNLEWHGQGFWNGRKAVELSSPKEMLPVQLPGPADGWAGGDNKEIRIKAPFYHKTEFTVRFLESHEAAPPFIEVWADDAKVAEFQVEKGTGYPRIHWPREGKTSKAGFIIHSRNLKKGTIITFRTVSGSWAALQTISAAAMPERWESLVAYGCCALVVLMTLVWIALKITQSALKPRQVIFAAILMAIGVLFGLATGEVTFRALDVLPKPMRTQPVRDFKLSSNPVILYEYRPGIRQGDMTPEGIENRISTNSAGFRDMERLIDKPEGTYRIIVIGDSTAAGSGVKSGEALFNRILEKQLNRPGESRSYEVINMGVHGYQTLQEVETLRATGLAYHPDLVITLFCHNDFQLNVDGNTYYNLLASNPDFKFESRTPGLRDWFLSHSRLAFVVYHRLMALIQPPTSFDEIVSEYREKYLHGKSTVEVGMESFSRMAKESGFTAVMAILPVFDRPFDKYRHEYQHDRVKKIVDKFDNIELLDLKDGFARIDNDASKFTTDGLHMNEAGHAALADILRGWMKNRQGSGDR
ncbi:MAG: SGNH/GDSL hydrolase family protein [Nitrospinota bacterium]|nr:SGNH/GDSL hydrolase family protein [Nitrospinota bacterium]